MAKIIELGLIKADHPMITKGFSIRTMVKFRKLKKKSKDEILEK